jgi:uncharacterized protein YndB with AHSA1/START domain
MAARSERPRNSDHEHLIERVFDAPARLLFEAYSQPEHLMQWFGPKGFPLTLCEVDFRVGGRYRFAMTGPDGVQGPAFGGEYLEIVADRRIQYSNRFEAPDAEEMIITVTFAEAQGTTTLSIHTRFASAAMKKKFLGMGYAEGIGSGLDQLRDVVAALGAR